MTLDRVVAVIPERTETDGTVTAPLFVMESGKCWWRVVHREGARPSAVEWVSAGPPVPGTVADGAQKFGGPHG